ncbi:MAG: hypothetical protein KAH23_02020 [Kiritimatiellae bacterium]|nr:hypothetical protein [Kiritimatiellia bacterium]
MSDPNNILIICRDLKSARRLSEFDHQPKGSYVLASDDPRVHEAAKGYSWIDEVCWVEQMESFYNVADDVIHITEIINEWLKILADDKHGFPEELLFFIRHAEGGMTTQRIQDMLLLIRSYHYILETHEITSVIVMKQSGMSWEDDILIETCRGRHIDAQIAGGYFSGGLIENVRPILMVYARAAYYAVNVFRINLRNRFKSKKNKIADKEIVFQLCSSAYKHVENIVPLMKALEHKGYDPVALCWHSSEKYTRTSGAKQVRAEGLQAEELENWCLCSDIWRSISGVFWTWKDAKRKKGDFLSHSMLNYQSVSLGALLWPTIHLFIVAELGQSYRLREALRRYFKSHVPLAIKLWGGTALRQGYLAWKSLETKGDKKPAVFEYWIGVAMESPYRIVDSSVDLFFVAGEHHKKFLTRILNTSGERIKLTGQARYEHVADVRTKYSKMQSRAYLGIPTTFSMYILFDSNMILRGFMAPREQLVVLRALLEFVTRNSSVALLVKPHPGHSSGILEDLISSCGCSENVFLHDKNMLPYHAINAADMLITKVSTLGVEAMLFDCPVICCVLDGEQHFNIYEGAVSHIEMIKDLEKLLLRLITDNDFRQEWCNMHMQMRKTFLAEYFCETEEQPSLCQARILERYLEKRID